METEAGELLMETVRGGCDLAQKGFPKGRMMDPGGMPSFPQGGRLVHLWEVSGQGTGSAGDLWQPSNPLAGEDWSASGEGSWGSDAVPAVLRSSDSAHPFISTWRSPLNM